MSDTSHPSQPLHRHEFTTVDKSDWGPGPWQDEPDKVAWVDPDTGLDCMAKRHERLGDPYLRAEAERHPHGDRAWLLKRLERQGGMAFEEWVEDQRPHRVCHVPPPGQPEEVWWFGFDCAHLGDHSPGVNGSFPSPADDEYRSLFYVERRVAELACQLAEIGR